MNNKRALKRVYGAFFFLNLKGGGAPFAFSFNETVVITAGESNTLEPV